MTGIFDEKCYKLFGMNTPKQKITNKSANKIIEKVGTIQTGLSQKCLESFGVPSQKRKQPIIRKEKVGNKNENKNRNTFFDFLYLYKKYHFENKIRVLHNESLKIQMIDNEKEIFIPIENFNTGNGDIFMFKYNDSSYFILNNIRFIYEGNIIYINNTSLVTQINGIDTIQGIPKYPSEYIPIISTLKIPNKLLHSVINGENRQPNDYIPLYFSIINKKFFIRYWNTNLYIDNGNFFILIQNKPLYFNEKIDNIINPNKDKEYTVGKNILDIYYNYPLKGMENKIEVGTEDGMVLKLLYQNNQTEIRITQVTFGLFFTNPINDNVRFKLNQNQENLEINFSRPMLNLVHISVRMNDCVVLNTDGTPIVIADNNSINIPGYNSTLFISKTLRELISPLDQKEIYYDFFRNLFFTNFFGMNLYFTEYNENYAIYTQEYVVFLDQNLNIFDTEYIIPSNEVGELSSRNLSNTSQSNKKTNPKPSTPSKYSFGSPSSTTTATSIYGYSSPYLTTRRGRGGSP